MQHLPILILSLALSVALTACTGSDGTDGAVGPQGEPGQAAQVEDLDVVAQMVVEDPAFRAKIVQLLVEQHSEELKGPRGVDGDDGECDCGDGSNTEQLPSCIQTCTTNADCGGVGPTNDSDNFECVDSACIYLGCISDEECADIPGTVCR